MSFFSLTLDKLVVIGVLAALLLGPERLPAYAQKLAEIVKGLRELANGAKSRMRDEMGPEFDEVDWKKLDPRQYDPRRIVRDALVDSPAGDGTAAASSTSSVPQSTNLAGVSQSLASSGAATAAAAGAGLSGAQRSRPATVLPEGPAPFDSEAT
ncbi:Sec-independent protein translocase TatB [Humidisolicoccus flavus]|uniref:Sec-independent protein translocase TatB n=1 Tax=Humidisolicoccus flavus TaxID=3111414 RepID=UPI00324957D5